MFKLGFASRDSFVLAHLDNVLNDISIQEEVDDNLKINILDLINQESSLYLYVSLRFNFVQFSLHFAESSRFSTGN